MEVVIHVSTTTVDPVTTTKTKEVRAPGSKKQAYRKRMCTQMAIVAIPLMKVARVCLQI